MEKEISLPTEPRKAWEGVPGFTRRKGCSSRDS